MFPSNFVKLLEVPAPAPTAVAPSVAAGYAPGKLLALSLLK